MSKQVYIAPKRWVTRFPRLWEVTIGGYVDQALWRLIDVYQTGVPVDYARQRTLELATQYLMALPPYPTCTWQLNAAIGKEDFVRMCARFYAPKEDLLVQRRWVTRFLVIPVLTRVVSLVNWVWFKCRKKDNF